MKFYIEYPIFLALIIPVIIAIIILLNKSFVKFRSKEEKTEYEKSHKGRRIFIIISRCLIMLYILIALSSPYTITEETSQGDYSLKILVDNSTSMSLFDSKIANKVFDAIKEKIPATIIPIAYGTDSSIGDAIVNNMHGNDNILLVSDGQNNYGKALGDVMSFANMLNTTVSALKIDPMRTDNSVMIEGPSEAIMGTPNEVFIRVMRAGDAPDYGLSVKIDNTPVTVEKTGADLYKFSKVLSQGYHKITAEIETTDFFPENNIFYKTLYVLPKPKVLYVNEKKSKFEDLLRPIYTLTSKDSVPDDLKEYSSVIIDDINAEKLNTKTDMLSDYIIEGGGLFVIGGENSFDRGGYQNSLFESILPVKVGEAGYEGELATNIVLVIDISESTGGEFSARSSNKKVDVEKALAIGILNDISLYDRIGVVAFNHKAHVLSQLSILGETQTNITEKISSLVFTGGTFVYSGLKQAQYLMDSSLGSKNIILISDGVDSLPDLAINLAGEFAQKNIRVYTVGVGEGTNSAFLQTIAAKTGASYFEPTETEKIKILFGNREELPPQDAQSIVLFNKEHFITKGLDIIAQATGYNYVVKKAASQMLASMGDGKPILTVWMYGLGRVAALSTDDGTKWSSQLLDPRNSKLLMRTLNWIIGDPQKDLNFYVKVKDAYFGETSTIVVKSDKTPVSNVLKFEKTDENMYRAFFTPEKTGYEEFFNAVMAVNYPLEYRNIGFNDELRDLVEITGGKVFEPADTDKLVEFIKNISVRKKSIPNYWRWPFVILALSIFIIEIFIRKIVESIRREK